MVKDLVSIIIPARNEKYLGKTIKDLIKKAVGKIEIIAVLDGYWPSIDEMVLLPRVYYVHYGDARGMRNAINDGVAISNGEFIMKTDAHCLFKEGFDRDLKESCKDNWVVVPRRYALDVEKWEVEKRTDKKYPIDYMFLNKDLNGEVWQEKNRDLELRKKSIDDLMSAQGSCWFMKKMYFDYLELLDEKTYGTFWQEFQEIGLKCWLSGGRVVVNKNTFYAHWHKTKSRGYSLPKREKEKTKRMIKKWLKEKVWHKQKYLLEHLVRKFSPVPTW